MRLIQRTGPLLRSIGARRDTLRAQVVSTVNSKAMKVSARIVNCGTIGAAYLIWLGIKTFRSEATALVVNGTHEGAQEGGPSRRSFYLQGLLVGASNPKAVLFFAAFFPQFLNPAAPMVPQFAILALTFMAFEFTVLTTCALSVSRLAPFLRQSGPVRWINRICGGLFTLMGGLLLLTRRSA